MKIFELTPTNGRKSFYGKAKVIEQDGEKILISYTTEVCKIDKNGIFQMLWTGRSNTTTAHIKAFKSFYGIA